MAFTAKPRVVRPSRTQVVVQAGKFRPQSRIGKKLVEVPKDVKITLNGNHLVCKGPNGELSREFHPLVTVAQEEGKLKFTRNEDTKEASALHGLSRALGQNMVTGVSTGFTKTLSLVGVGYRASAAGKELTLNLGYSHPVVLEVPEGLQASVEKNTTIVITGADKDILGNFAAVVRSKRPPEPYKGKGVRYVDEQVKLKAGKSGK